MLSVVDPEWCVPDPGSNFQIIRTRTVNQVKKIGIFFKEKTAVLMSKTYKGGDDITADYHERLKPNQVKVPTFSTTFFTSFLRNLFFK